MNKLWLYNRNKSINYKSCRLITHLLWFPPAESSSAFASFHSFGVRPSYTWTPIFDLDDYIYLGTSLFTYTALSDEERKSIPPDTISDAARKMQRTQQKQYSSLKRLQYLVSDIFRPLNILGYEISFEAENTAAQQTNLNATEQDSERLNSIIPVIMRSNWGHSITIYTAILSADGINTMLELTHINSTTSGELRMSYNPIVTQTVVTGGTRV
ncbi:MAG: hypothetical protein EXX96DRAFT_537449 [Benjaminiella poitrasii]|nr:MAG: hypothetical protein EXX96DRAFT_537449 [Benjaminiella poitrasii]